MTPKRSKVLQYPLVEKFYSVQGEGANAGRAAFFIRFAGCNLDCVFADGAVCDTPWRKANEKLTFDEIIEWMRATLMAHGWSDARYQTASIVELPIVIITGGEPTMAVGFDALVENLRVLGYYVAVESNGTIWRDSLPNVDWLVVSPKTDVAQGKPLHASTPRPDVLSYASEVRTVITADSPTPLFYRHAVNYVSPALEADGTGLEHTQGITPKFAAGAVDRCMEIVLQEPRFRLSLQTHKWLRVR